MFIGQTFLARPGNPMIYKSDALKTVGQITVCRRIDDMGVNIVGQLVKISCIFSAVGRID